MTKKNAPNLKDIVRVFLQENPTIPNRTAARLIAQKYPQFFTIESARGVARELRGVAGPHRTEGQTDRTLAEQWAMTKAEIPEPIKYDFSPILLPPGADKVLVLSDAQVPFHDKMAIEVAIEKGVEDKVDCIIVNGDWWDCMFASDHERNPALRDLAVEAMATRQTFATLRAEFPKAEIIFKVGNHEERLGRLIMRQIGSVVTFLENTGRKKDSLLEVGGFLGLNDYGVRMIETRQPILLGEYLWVLHGHEYGATSIPVNPARSAYLKVKACALVGHHHQTSQNVVKTMDGHSISTYSQGCLCHSSDTEVLTAEGFKLFENVTKEDWVAEYTKENQTIHYRKPKALQKLHYDGELINFRASRFDQLVTPEHKMLTYRKDRAEQFICESAQETFNREKPIGIPIAGYLDSKEILYYGDERDRMLAELIGFIITDGHYRKLSNGIRIYQKNKYTRIKYLLDSLAVPYSEGLSRDIPVFGIPSSFGKIIRQINPIKNEISRKLLSQQKEVLIGLYEGLISGDGHRKINTTEKTTDYFSTHFENTTNQFQELCHKIGFSCLIQKFTYEKTNLCSRQSYIYKCFVRKFTTCDIQEKLLVPYNGLVYDLTTESGFFIVRRNGIVSVSGNCDLNPHWKPVNDWNHGFARVDITKEGGFTLHNYRISRRGEIWI